VANLKVLDVIDSGGLYGAEVMLLHLVAEQIRQGIEPIIASIGEKGIEEKPLETEAKKRGFRVEKFRMMPGPNFPGASKILRFAWSDGVNILHSHGYKGNILLGFIPKPIRRIPIITTVHGYTSRVNGFNRMRLYEWLDSRALGLMDAVVFVSNAMKSDPHFRHLCPEKVNVIHNGIPLTPDEAQALNSDHDSQNLDSILEFCKKGYIIGSIGRLSPEKGYENLIRALAHVVNKGLDARLLLIGQGALKEKLVLLASELGLTSRIMFAGYQKAAFRFFHLMNVFVISSLTEGLPMTLLEAMRAKVPIIATRVGGIPDILTDPKDAILLPPKDEEGLASAILRISCNPEKTLQMTENAYKKFKSELSSYKMAKQYSSLYKELLRRDR